MVLILLRNPIVFRFCMVSVTLRDMHRTSLRWDLQYKPITTKVQIFIVNLLKSHMVFLIHWQEVKHAVVKGFYLSTPNIKLFVNGSGKIQRKNLQKCVTKYWNIEHQLCSKFFYDMKILCFMVLAKGFLPDLYHESAFIGMSVDFLQNYSYFISETWSTRCLILVDANKTWINLWRNLSIHYVGGLHILSIYDKSQFPRWCDKNLQYLLIVFGNFQSKRSILYALYCFKTYPI